MVVALLVVQAVSGLYLPNLNADIINDGVVKGDLAYIWRTGGEMVAISLVAAAAAIAAAYLSARVAMAVGRDLRRDVFRAVQGFSVTELNRFGAPSLITRNTNDVQQVQMFVVFALTVIVIAPIMAVGGAAMALHEDVTLSWLVAVAVPLMIGVIGVLMYFALPLFMAMQERIDRVNQVLREQITGIRVVRAFVRAERERERFEDANRALTDTALRVNRIFSAAMPAMFTIFNLSSVAVVWFGGLLVDRGSMPIGNLLAFLTYLIQILFAVMMATMIAIFIPRASACADRIGEVLEVLPSIPGGGDAEPSVKAPPAGFEFRDVGFRYPGAEHAVLNGVSFAGAPGETVAVIGSTGSGKTTVVHLLTRSFDVTSGAVSVGGVDVREQPLQAVLAQIGLVPQKAYLFSGTVAENLRMARADATDQDLWEALEIAQATDFVRELPDGLETRIAQGGTDLSGGQRQRLAIARALVKRPQIYIFDDCFSALDAATDARLRAALAEHTADATVLVVSQRVSTIMSADRIVVLEEGRVEATGTHRELMERAPTYREIVDSQLRGQEAVAS